ncbi:class III lanthionine synthetase LanKC [Kitasatospora viridis]|uniref:Lanthionine synthetase-like protein n=1 Tax=Kitasatospora viridis TaxID=281105 RepID=A0A561UC97_9ACTN|nr:class III lanthionine synthetase LanKC [Kitasatospora viridis]TWF96985.1 lanthionine synthetase-like protein [Kitasatospora viridis]
MNESASDGLAHTLADRDFYLPLEAAPDPGAPFAPGRVGAGWQWRTGGVWTYWVPPGESLGGLPVQGWKVHVSATAARAGQVLDAAAEVFFAHRVVFKHLSAEAYFRYLHHKHGPRQQAGKFIAGYPVDVERAREVLEALRERLGDEPGPFVLTDRRYRDSPTVHYRYGGFRPARRLRADGTVARLIRRPDGEWVADLRLPAFTLPDGVRDPFAEPEAEPEPASAGPVVLGEYEITAALRHSNAGGSYLGQHRATGRKVFVKEARAHNGLSPDGSCAQERLRREHRTLVALHAAAPGLAPEPLGYLREWEHEFLVTEFLGGTSLHEWTARHAPVARAAATREQFAAYYARCTRLAEQLERAVGRLHELGYAFGDLNSRNVLVDEGPDGRDTLRLIDFETATTAGQPSFRIGTPGFAPPRGLFGEDREGRDRYALSAVLLCLLFPLHPVLDRSPANLPLLERELTALSPVPAELWRKATEFVPARPARPLDTALPEFTAGVARGLLALAGRGPEDAVFPLAPDAYRTNRLGYAHGLAGILSALRQAAVPVPAEFTERLRRAALAGRAELPPGLNCGTAGIAWALAELGEPDAATALAEHAVNHPLGLTCVTLGDGAAGIGLALLAVHARTGDQRLLERADALGDRIAAATRAGEAFGAADPRGLLAGRAGLAHFLRQLSAATGRQGHYRTGLRLIHEELDRAVELPGGALSFAPTAGSRRAVPYLAGGSAGVGLALLGFARPGADDRLTGALGRIVADASKPLTVKAGLFRGLAGLLIFLTDHAAWSGGASARQTVDRSARCLTTHAIPHGDGFRFLGGDGRRYSCDLASGSSGVLLALGRALQPGPGGFLAPVPD